MKQTFAIGAAALLVGVAGGYLIGNRGDSGDQAQAAADATVGSAKISRSAGRDQSESPPGAARARPESLGATLSEPGQTARIQALIDRYADMAPHELEEEAKRLDELPIADRIMASILLFGRWGELDPYAALNYTNSMGFAGRFVRPTVMRSWAGTDPASAARYFTDNPREFAMMGGRGRGENAAGLLAGEWAKLDPNSAMEWAETLEGENRSEARVAALAEMAKNDPEEAARMARNLEGEEAANAAGEVARSWASKDFAEAEAWISTLSGEAKQDAMASAYAVLANSDPEGAATRTAQMEQGRERERAVESVARSWAMKSPSDAASWVLQEGGDDADDAMRDVISSWTGQDAAGARAFIDEQPSGGVRDSAVQSYLWSNPDTDMGDAVSLAESMSDGRRQERTLGMTVARWMQEDAESARSYVEQSQIFDDRMKERLLNDR